jgi:Flp pilus assembly protein TadG
MTGATRVRGAARGQALLEFALVLPVFLAVALLCIQLCVLGVRWWQLNSAAGVVVRQAAAGNGETRAVDDAVLRVAAANGLQDDHLWARFDTDAGAGRQHRADQAQSSDAPPLAGYGGTVTVRLTYQAPLLFGLFGGAVPLGATFSQESPGAYGGLAP